MKKHNCLIVFLLIVAVAGLGACRRRQSANQNANANAAAQEQPAEVVVAGKPVAGDTFYFRGAIGANLKIEMKLTRDGERVSGTYLYPKIGKDIEVKGNIDPNGNLTLKEFDAGGKETGVFKCKWSTGESDIEGLPTARIEGKWSRPDGSKETEFHVEEEPIQFTGAERVVTKRINEANQEQHLAIETEYPQVIG